MADLILADLEKIPGPGESIYNLLGAQLRIGGNPSNVAVDLVQLGCRKGEVGVVGSVGSDPYGEFIEEHLRKKGVRVYLTKSRKTQTSKAVVLVVTGEDRRAILGLGANTEMSFEYVKTKVEECRPQVFYQASGVLGAFESRVKEIFQINRKAGAINVFDFIRPYDNDWSSIRECCELSDIVHCNEHEIRELTGLQNVKDGLRTIGAYGAGIAVTSLGERGICAYLPSSRVFVEQRGFEVQSVDPTGAGDALLAGILFGLLSRSIVTKEDLDKTREHELSRVLAYGQACAAACIRAVGTTEGVQKAEADSLFKEQGEDIVRSTKFSS